MKVDELMGLVAALCNAAHDQGMGRNPNGARERANLIKAELRTALSACVTGWQGMDSAPTDEIDSFIVLRQGVSDCAFLELQVSRFQGDLYPDHMGSNIDYGDRITDAVAWRPVLKYTAPTET